MENNFNAGAFTKDRVDILQTLTSQMAISLEKLATIMKRWKTKLKLEPKN